MSIDDVRLIEFSVDQIDGMKRVDAIAEHINSEMSDVKKVNHRHFDEN